MQKALRACVGWLVSVWRAWNDFWFTPVSPALLGCLRILAGAMLVYTHAVWGLALEDFFGPNSWNSPEAVAALQENQYAFSYWWYVPANLIWPAHLAALAILALFMLGLFTRVTSILSFLIVVSYVNRVPVALFGLDQINGMLTLYLAIGPGGAAFSLDRVITRMRAQKRGEPAPLQPSVGANLALRLIQVHMCVIYFFAGISKFQGLSWWGGDAMWRAFANLEYQSRDMTWLAEWPTLINIMTHVTVLWEISFCMLIWRPLCRPVVLVLAVLLHVGIGACLGMWTFGLVMLIGCAAFLPPDLFGLARSNAPSLPNDQNTPEPPAAVRSPGKSRPVSVSKSRPR